MGFKLISQIVLIVASLVIIFTFIKPSFVSIKATQDEMYQYKDTLAKATQFNALLQELMSQRDSIPANSMKKLENFVPSKIDALQIMKDIETIFSLNGVPIVSLSATEKISPKTDVNFEGDVVEKNAALATSYQDFDVSFTTSYSQMKNILLLVEANATLLEVIDFQFDTLAEATEERGDIEQIKTGDYNYKMKLRAYGLVESKN